jgi:hypothetical protein
MSNSSPENFNLNLLNSSTEAMGDPQPTADEDGASFAAQLAGGGNNEFIIPTGKKKVSAGMLVFAGIAVVAAGGLWWMNQRTGGPAPAEAADADVTAARASIQQFLAGGTGSVAEMKSLLADSGQITDKYETYSENRQVPLEDLKTNPFYAPVEEEEAVVDAPVVDLSRQQLEERARREAERVRLEQERLTLAASKLHVQTIFYGKSPTALVDGKICQVGQQLGEFTVSAIRPDAIEVRNGELTFEVKLKR